jgi:hypothetical protein
MQIRKDSYCTYSSGVHSSALVSKIVSLLNKFLNFRISGYTARYGQNFKSPNDLYCRHSI